MGGPMALNLLKAGHSLTVYDVRRAVAEPHLAAGARWAESPAAASADSVLVFTSLPGPKEVEEVATGEGGILSRLAPGAIYADLSTNSPALIRRLNAAFKTKGIEMLDTPVSGGVVGARNAKLAVMVGGDQATFEKIRPALEAIGDKISYIGESGAGAVAKLVHNMIALCSTQLLAEAFTMGVKAGVSRCSEGRAGRLYGQGCCLRECCPRWYFAAIRSSVVRVEAAKTLDSRQGRARAECADADCQPGRAGLPAALANGLGESSTAAVTIRGRAAVSRT
jgi:3-hydroxyisobutyrate dehydrogenase